MCVFNPINNNFYFSIKILIKCSKYKLPVVDTDVAESFRRGPARSCTEHEFRQWLWIGILRRHVSHGRTPECKPRRHHPLQELTNPEREYRQQRRRCGVGLSGGGSRLDLTSKLLSLVASLSLSRPTCRLKRRRIKDAATPHMPITLHHFDTYFLSSQRFSRVDFDHHVGSHIMGLPTHSASRPSPCLSSFLFI